MVGYHDQNDAAGTGSAKHAFVGGTYNFGPATFHLGLDRQKTDAAGVTTVDGNDVLIGATISVGSGTIMASYNRLNYDTAANVDRK